jgi:hypothetical protein
MTTSTEPEVNALPTCRWTGYTVSPFIADATEAMDRDLAVAAALRHDLAKRHDLTEHVREAATAHLRRRENSAAFTKHLLESIAMGKETDEQLAAFALGRGPVTVRNLAGLLYQHGRKFDEAEGKALSALTHLVQQKKAERKEVHGVDLYLLPGSTPVAPSQATKV